MHEASIAQSILNIALAKLQQTPQAIKILKVKVMLGEFRNIDVDSLQFAFDSLKASFAGCQDCELVAEVIEASANCHDCGCIYHPDFEKAFRCINCGGGIGKLIRGKELDVVSITIEKDGKE